jgi:O-antigen/teichoic acid export membrane protein
VGPLMVSFDQFLIGSVMGVAAVAHYAVPMNLVARTQIFPGALARTFFPRMSCSSADDARSLSGRALSVLGYGYAALCAPGIVLSPVFFRYWISADFGQIAAPVAQILFVGAWINGLAFIAATLLQSQGRPDITGKLHLIEVLPFLAVLWTLTTTFGINGAAIAWSLRTTADALALFWAAGMSKKIVFRAIARPGLLLCGSEVTARFVGSSPGFAVPAAAIAGLIGFGLAFAYCGDWREFLRIQFGLRARGFAMSLVRRAKPAQSA